MRLQFRIGHKQVERKIQKVFFFSESLTLKIESLK